MKKIIIVILIIILAVLAFFYFTRSVLAPITPIDKFSEKLTVSNQATDKLYRISQADSKVEFQIGEILSGNQFTAIGNTNQIAGDVIISDNNIKIGTIIINAKTFKTDSRERDGAIARFILKSETLGNEFITFKPAVITDILPATITSGKIIPLTITGDLTIAGITKEASFTVKLNLRGDKVTATASTMVKRSDYGLTIPNIPFVANVDETFPVQITITANLVK